MKLSKQYGVSLDLINGIKKENQIVCRYIPLNLEDPASYMTFLNRLSHITEKIRLTDDSEIIQSAVAIPFLNLLPYKELAFFKIFSWNKSVYGYDGNYEDFTKILDTSEFLNMHKKITGNYENTPSSEIWTFHTTDTIIRLISYHHEMKHFGFSEFPLFLCEQLLELINRLQEWTEKGTKGPEQVPFKLYVSEIDTGNTFVIFKIAGQVSCLVRQFTLNGFYITDDLFCHEAENWLSNLAQRAVLISGASEIERFKFFTGQRQKIEFLIEKIKGDLEGF